ncbi:unnamed protein product [Gongylonema pulchrum]|uniref:DUF2052 domain-containing protein n=1 Tax=Gongylonema pulchrum TaxID=637853 RepID=A0A183CUH8_9BILA|nr:unnamed protein product [Gongylonema pulchrum]
MLLNSIFQFEEKGFQGGRRKRGKLSSEEKQKQAEEMPMAFPKGTFLLRYSDLQDLECDQIWCVDNQYMLLKYIPSSHIDEKRPWEEAKRQRELHEETKAEASSTTGDLSSYANFTAGSAVNQPILNKEQQQQVFDNYKLFFEQGSSLEMDQYDGVEAYEEIDDAVAAELLGDDFVILNDNDQ